MTEDQTKVAIFENNLFLLCPMARGQLYAFTYFHAEIEALLKNKDADLQSKIDEESQLHHEFQQHDVMESYSQDLHQNKYNFPNIHRESLVITIYNFLEAQLNDLCNTISLSINSKIKLKDLKGRGVTRAFLYLTNVAEIDFTAMDNEKLYISNVNLLRNRIVHNGGLLPDKTDKKLNPFVLNNPNLSGIPGSNVSLSPEFIREFINTLIKFFEILDVEIQELQVG